LAHLVAGSVAAAPIGLSFLLAEEAPIMPLFLRSTRLLVKPWVIRFPTTGFREWFFKDVIIKPHQ
jgi:hypothetical protein